RGYCRSRRKAPPCHWRSRPAPRSRRPAASPPGEDAPRLTERGPDDPAVVIAAIAEEPAIRHIKRAVEDGERAALVLHPRAEGLPLRAQCIGHIDRPAGQYRAILQR